MAQLAAAAGLITVVVADLAGARDDRQIWLGAGLAVVAAALRAVKMI